MSLATNLSELSIDPAIPVVLTNALDWVEAHLHEFNPFLAQEDHGVDEVRVKALYELAFTCATAYRMPSEHEQSRFESITNFIIQLVGRHLTPGDLIDNPSLLFSSITHQTLSKEANKESAISIEFLQSIIDTNYITGMERLPFRKMELSYTLDQISICHALPPPEQFYRETLAANHPRLPSLNLTDAYAITHTIFYLTDMGHSIPPYLRSEELIELRWLCRTLAGIYLRTSNLDILGEFVICLHQLGDSPTLTLRTAWHRLISSQDPSGFVPGPAFSRSRQRALPDDEQAGYVFLNCYHTTLVTIIACLHWLYETRAEHKDGYEAISILRCAHVESSEG